MAKKSASKVNSNPSDEGTKPKSNTSKKTSSGGVKKNNKIKKIFVLDTNVILHDSSCVNKFEEHDVVIPIQVIEELDNFKKGFDEINYHAREFCRKIDELSEDHIFNGGVSLGEGFGKLKISLAQDWLPIATKNLKVKNVDAEIINLALVLQKDNEDKRVIIVSKDVNLRLKAKALQVVAQDFLHSTLVDIDILNQKVANIKVISSDLDSLYKNGTLEIKIPNSMENQNFIFNTGTGSASAIVRYQDGHAHLILKEKLYAFNIKSRNSEQAFAFDALLDPEIQLVAIEGKAGSGKTIIALACALEQLKRKTYGDVYFSRQTISVGNHEIGFLPGDTKDKISPFMNAMKDNLGVLKSVRGDNESKINEYLKNEKLIIEPIAFIRGRSLHKVFFIVDEAQNLTPHEVKTIVTRAGEGTKIVFIGDTRQIDSPYLDQRSNGLSYLIEKFKNQPTFSYVHLIKSERSPLAELAGDLL